MPRNPLAFDPERVLLAARKATTEDLLDRVTAFRQEMEPEAVAILEKELHSRGISDQAIAAHSLNVQEQRILREDGTVARCSFCHRAAVAQGRGWYKLLKILPVFPRPLFFCPDHDKTKEF